MMFTCTSCKKLICIDIKGIGGIQTLGFVEVK